MNGIGDFLQWLACLILYSPIEPDEIDTELNTVNEKQQFVPILDSCGGANTLTANFTNANVGRIRGQAFGCSNFVQNKRGVIGADFAYLSGIAGGDILTGIEYEFRARVAARGRMRHFPAETPGGSPPFGRNPAPFTIGLVFTYIRIFQVNDAGDLFEIERSPQILHRSVTHPASAGVILLDPFDLDEEVSLRFTPINDGPVFFEVEVSVQGGATGSFSDIQIGSFEDASSGFATVEVSVPIAQKVLEDDACAELFGR
ncbi:hypothetical protein [Tautonia rosea]|uniref:hypothetical protein n=1 Tax=Tautonia rosea TaxID=2728037 RepID=UPI0014736FEF|nr:hypothetical protein [Tautonia rosea]